MDRALCSWNWTVTCRKGKNFKCIEQEYANRKHRQKGKGVFFTFQATVVEEVKAVSPQAYQLSVPDV